MKVDESKSLGTSRKTFVLSIKGTPKLVIIFDHYKYHYFDNE